jgi:hypothetical protein
MGVGLLTRLRAEERGEEPEAAPVQPVIFENVPREHSKAAKPAPRFVPGFKSGSEIDPETRERLDKAFGRKIAIREIRKVAQQQAAVFGWPVVRQYVVSVLRIKVKADKHGRDQFTYGYDLKDQENYAKVFTHCAACLTETDFQSAKRAYSVAAARTIALFCVRWMSYSSGFQFFHGVEHFAKDLGMDAKAIRRGLNTFLKAGLLTRRRFGKRSQYIYRVCPDALFEEHKKALLPWLA